MNSRPVYVSTGGLPGKNLTAMLSAAERLGIGHVELGSGVPYAADNADIARRYSKRIRLLAHNYFPAPRNPFVLNLAALDSEIRSLSLDHCRRAIQLNADLGAPFYSVHAGFAAYPRPEHLGRAIDPSSAIPRKDAYRMFGETVKILLDDADKAGISLFIENNVVSLNNLLNGRNAMLLLAEPEEIVRFVAEINHPRFGVLMDVGHLKVSARTLGFDAGAALEALLPQVRAFHLSDNDGLVDSNRPFGADAWFMPALTRARDAHVIIELCRVTEQEALGTLGVVRSVLDANIS